MLMTNIFSLKRINTENDNRQIFIYARIYIRNKIKEKDEEIAKELQNGNKSNSRAKNQD